MDDVLLALVAVAIVVLLFTTPAQAPADSGGGIPAIVGPGVTPGTAEFARAIAHAEGFGIDGAIPTRAHNPGDLVLNTGGATIGAEGITVFANDDDGWTALHHQLNLIAAGQSHVYTADMTITEMAAVYSPSGADAWAANVADWLNNHGYAGTTPDTPIGTVLAG